MRRKLLFGGLGALVALLAIGGPVAAQDELSVEIVQANLDNTFVLLAAVLVIFMQVGFALVEAGQTRAKSVGNIMMKNMMDFCAGVIAFFAVGYAIAYGGDGNDLFGLGNWFLLDTSAYEGTGLTPQVDFVFQVAFAATAATIVSGAMAERTRFRSYFVYSIFITAIIYPVVVHWNWGGGWLAQRETPFIDFAGSTIVHSVGGWAAMMGALVLGPRLGKYGPDGKPRLMPGHSVAFTVIGALILLVGWYGFNPGSELAADAAIGAIALTTTLAAAAGAIFAMLTVWIVSGKPDVSMAANGLLAGLVGITAGCASVENGWALVIGAIAGVLVVFSVMMFDRIKIDDPVGAISVHGVCGAWGTLAVGFFAIDTGLFDGGGADQLVTQVVGIVAVFVWTVVTSGLVFLGIKYTIGLRVPEDEEITGLDVAEHGVPGYGPELFQHDFYDAVKAKEEEEARMAGSAPPPTV